MASVLDRLVTSTASMDSLTILAVLTFSIVIISTRAQSNTAYGTIQPVLAVDFADPSMIEVNGTWFAFATSGNGYNVQAAASPSFTNHEWRLLNETNVLPDPGPWAMNDRNIWAPDVIHLVGPLSQVKHWSKLTSVLGAR